MRYFKEKETGDIVLVKEDAKKTIEQYNKDERYTEWFIYNT